MIRNTNKIDLSKETLYFELLEIEIDQVGSGPTLIALVTGNRELAEKCNLLGGPFNCIYSFLLEKTVLFLEENIPDLDKTSNVYKLLTEEIKAQKYALMCFFYNELHMSSTTRWRNLYEELYGISAPDKDYQVLSGFSKKYPQFMEYVFSNLTKQLELLNEAALLITSQNLPQKIGTLDNCILSWDFDHTQELKRNYFNPVSGTHDPYKLRVKVNDPTKKS